MQCELTALPNELPVILLPMAETPRAALAICIRGGISRELQPGVAKLASRLLLKGTATRSAEALALELDARAIELREYALPDCQVLTATFLTRELPAVVELLADMLRSSTFDDFDKEREKLFGEINASLDLPADSAQDLLIRTLLDGNPYGHTGTRVLETLPGLEEAQVRTWFADGMQARAMNITLVGDFSAASVLPLLAEHFGGIPVEMSPVEIPPFIPLERDLVVTRPRADAQQAQIYQGWYSAPLGSPAQPALAVMNTVLGAGGLSSRLFVELRDKQGLAYSVRSSYTPLRLTGEFIISIGTSPENIARARAGFTEQLTRLQQEPITQEELLFAKGKLAGTFILAHETTTQHCLDMAISQINGMGADYSERLLERMQAVTIADVQAAAQSIVSPSVTAIVAREDALPENG